MNINIWQNVTRAIFKKKICRYKICNKKLKKIKICYKKNKISQFYAKIKLMKFLQSQKSLTNISKKIVNFKITLEWKTKNFKNKL